MYSPDHIKGSIPYNWYPTVGVSLGGSGEASVTGGMAVLAESGSAVFAESPSAPSKVGQDRSSADSRRSTRFSVQNQDLSSAVTFADGREGVGRWLRRAERGALVGACPPETLAVIKYFACVPAVPTSRSGHLNGRQLKQVFINA